MREVPAGPVPAALRFLVLLALSIVSLGSGALLGARLAMPGCLLLGSAGFSLYVFLFGLAIRQLPVDWNCWRDRTLESLRSSPRMVRPGRAASSGPGLRAEPAPSPDNPRRPGG